MASPVPQGWTHVTITGLASVVVQGMILLPLASQPVARVVVQGNSRTRLLPAGVRADHGTAAVLPGDLLTTLGGDGAQISYRAATWMDVLRLRRRARVQLAIAVLTLIAAILAAINAYVGTRSPTTPTFTADAAPWVLFIGVVLTVWKLYSDITDDLK